MRKVIKDFLKKNEGHPIAALQESLVGNIGLVFTNGDLPKVRDMVLANKVPAPARVGSAAQSDVFVEPGPTGCDPGQTAWFQALNIPTKINKGQIEMVSKVHLIKKGEKVTESQAALLQKLNIKPFAYGMVITGVYEAGAVFSPAVLDIKDEEVVAKFTSAIATLAALSLGLGFPTKASIVHSLNDAYKTLIAIGMGTDFKFKQVEAFENFKASDAPAAAAGGAAAPAAGGKAEAAAAKVEEKKEEEEEDAGGAGGLFGGDDDW
jgi:large subunit ribosomal protein LP0